MIDWEKKMMDLVRWMDGLIDCIQAKCIVINDTNLSTRSNNLTVFAQIQ